MKARLASLLLVGIGACGGDDGGSGEDAATDAAGTADAAPLVTPANLWTWVEIPGSTCGNGSPAGFGLNHSTASGDLYVYFQGGGACWDGPSCFVDRTSINIETTYTAAQFANEIGDPQVNHVDPGNPLAASSWVFVPYCTGDLHAGARHAEYAVDATLRTVEHTGATNTQRFVDALRATYPAARTIWLAGSSAGGFGATLNLHRFAAAWPAAGVHLLQDGAPFVPVLSNYATWQASWSLQFPPGCTDCATSFPAVVDAVAAAHPTSRIGLMHYDNDAVIAAYFGYTGSLVPATDALLANQYDRPNTHAFVLAGDGHTMIGQLGTLTGAGGVRLIDWVVQWATGDLAWTTVR